MKVKELKERLSKLPEDMEVLYSVGDFNFRELEGIYVSYFDTFLLPQDILYQEVDIVDIEDMKVDYEYYPTELLGKPFKAVSIG